MIRHQIHKLVDDLFDVHSLLTLCGRIPQARGHFRSARREVLLGLRAVLDGAVKRMERKDSDDEFVRVPVDN